MVADGSGMEVGAEVVVAGETSEVSVLTGCSAKTSEVCVAGVGAQAERMMARTRTKMNFRDMMSPCGVRVGWSEFTMERGETSTGGKWNDETQRLSAQAFYFRTTPNLDV